MKRGRMGKPKPEAEPAAPLFEEKTNVGASARFPEPNCATRDSNSGTTTNEPDPITWSEHQRLLAEALRPPKEESHD